MPISNAILGIVRSSQHIWSDTPWWTDPQDAAVHALGSPVMPDAFLEPTSGTAANGLPILSWDQAAAQIDRDSNGWGGFRGASAVVTYAFRATAPASMPDDTGGFQQFNAAQILAAEEALRLWSEVANITFVRVGSGTSGPDAYSNNATILFGDYTTGAEGAAAFAYYPGSTASSAVEGDVWVNVSLDYNANPVFGDYGPHALAHEIGHAIGLAHPGDYNAGPNVDITYQNSAEYWQDSRMFSIMSYFGSTNTGGQLGAYSSGPQLHDIAAAQLLYGANMTTRTGNTTYGFNSNTGHEHFTITGAAQAAVFAIWDAGGIDTLDLSGYSTNSDIDLREEAFSSAGPGNPGLDAIGNISIARGAIIENAIGGSGSDIITGNDVNNSLTGNGGNDALYGGLGIDTANYSIASTSATWTRNATGNWIVSAGVNGTDSVNSVEFLHFTDRDVHLDTAERTYSGDGTSDILFRNTSGAVVSWNVTGTALASSAALANLPVAQWTALGSGDLNGDGRDDILWRNVSTGGVYSWNMNGDTITSVGAIASLGAEWSFLGAGDFNGDGKDDLAWRNTNGAVYSWDMNGSVISSSGPLASLGAEWSLKGIGDFNGDGKDDFLWRNSSGGSYIWSMNDRAISVAATSAQAANDWHIMGVGDFNGDGRDDILWQNDSGQVAEWTMNGATLSSSGFIAVVGPEWHIMGVGDYNGDGKDDILWQNNNGAVYAWMLNGSSLLSAGAIASVGPEWTII